MLILMRSFNIHQIAIINLPYKSSVVVSLKRNVGKFFLLLLHLHYYLFLHLLLLVRKLLFLFLLQFYLFPAVVDWGQFSLNYQFNSLFQLRFPFGKVDSSSVLDIIFFGLHLLLLIIIWIHTCSLLAHGWVIVLTRFFQFFLVRIE